MTLFAGKREAWEINFMPPDTRLHTDIQQCLFFLENPQLFTDIREVKEKFFKKKAAKFTLIRELIQHKKN